MADALVGEAMKKYKSLLLVTDEKAGADEIERLMEQTAHLRKSYPRSRTLLFFSNPHAWLAMAASIAVVVGAIGLMLARRGDAGLVIVDTLSQVDAMFAMRGDSDLQDSGLILSNLQVFASQEIGRPVELVSSEALDDDFRFKLVVAYADGPDDMIALTLYEVATGRELARELIPVGILAGDLQETIARMLRAVRQGRK